ncbi:MAG TPA: phage head-tail adapter protein [Bacilli bacterium]|nr:phage head-tail adapter protein [Bacilli bacterium]
MNKNWSNLNKEFQIHLKKENFGQGIAYLLELRKTLFDFVCEMKANLTLSTFSHQPFPNHKGYENKTIAYSLYHIFRIEDIVANILINGKEKDLFLEKDYQKRLNSPLITTGNELVKEEIRFFSEKLNIDALYEYITDVYENSNNLIQSLSFENLKQSFSKNDKERIQKAKVVSPNENARWLIDYWGNKDVEGLLKMPFSRHWIMHIEACEKIRRGIKKS